jgi:hypothetical protein
MNPQQCTASCIIRQLGKVKPEHDFVLGFTPALRMKHLLEGEVRYNTGQTLRGIDTRGKVWYGIDPSLRCELAPVTRFRTKAGVLFCLSLPFQSTLSTWHLTLRTTPTRHVRFRFVYPCKVQSRFSKCFITNTTKMYKACSRSAVPSCIKHAWWRPDEQEQF